MAGLATKTKDRTTPEKISNGAGTAYVHAVCKITLLRTRRRCLKKPVTLGASWEGPERRVGETATIHKERHTGRRGEQTHGMEACESNRVSAQDRTKPSTDPCFQRRGVLTLTQPTGWEGAREPKENRADQGQDTRRTPQGARPMAIPCLGFPVSHRCCDWPDPIGWVRRRSSWPLSDKGATAGSLVGTSPSPPQLGWAPTPDSTKRPREEDALAEA